MNEQEEKVREKKQYSKRGERSQKHFSFRIDLDNLERLQVYQNKGRFINEAIKKALDEQ